MLVYLRDGGGGRRGIARLLNGSVTCLCISETREGELLLNGPETCWCISETGEGRAGLLNGPVTC